MKSQNARDTASVIAPGGKSNSIRGVGFVELILALALVSITVGLATPVYHETLEKHKTVLAAEQVAMFISAAMRESIKLGKEVVVSYEQQSANWCMGATIGKKPCDCSETSPEEPAYCAIASSTWLLHESDTGAGNTISIDSGDGSFTFDPVRGTLLDPSDDLALTLRAGQSHFQTDLQMIATGRIYLCRQADGEGAERVDSC